MNISDIPATLKALEKRAQHIDKGAFVTLTAWPAGRWVAAAHSIKIDATASTDPFIALTGLDAALAKLEDRDGALSRTLGAELQGAA
jgi:hypothetical protein